MLSRPARFSTSPSPAAIALTVFSSVWKTTFLRGSTLFLARTSRIAPVSSRSASNWASICGLNRSGLATGASWLCYFRALKLGPATLVAPIDKLSVVLVALFAFLFLGERPSATGWLGIVLIAAGAVLLAVKK